MKNLIAPLCLAMLLAPQISLAAETGETAREVPAAFQQVHQQMGRLHEQARSQILAALTPANRTLLANTIGQLAVSAKPDREAAARTLNAALSQNESQAILRIHESVRAQSRSIMEAAHAKLAASMSAEEKSEMQAHMATQMTHMKTAHPPLDAGHILLKLGMHGDGMHGEGMHGEVMHGEGPGAL